MNQKIAQVKLRTLTSGDRPFGNAEGREVFLKLLKYVQDCPESDIFAVSLAGITATDASFPRESVVALAKHLRNEKGFFLEHLTDRDLIDNWNYAAQAKDQPLVIWAGDLFEILGPEMSIASRELVEFVLRNGPLLASQVAAGLNLSIQNASTRLKNAVLQGYLRRDEEVAESGGKEYRYSSIH